MDSTAGTPLPEASDSQRAQTFLNVGAPSCRAPSVDLAIDKANPRELSAIAYTRLVRSTQRSATDARGGSQSMTPSTTQP